MGIITIYQLVISSYEKSVTTLSLMNCMLFVLCIVEVFSPGLKFQDVDELTIDLVTWSWESSFCHSFSFVGYGSSKVPICFGT